MLDLPLAATAARIPPTLAELVDAGEGTQTLLRMRVESLDWMASVLAGLGCDFTVVQPPELRRERRWRSPSPRGPGRLRRLGADRAANS